ncbi:hypothetical protein QJU87_04310 [Pasteurella skyensis]|uniref:hypothetical protein n=1 Tax=Phocoenobacter skyensis TaxID=97481 RepID=UPI0027787DCD|nr:hypothetical protein [Pasteurella skyensis]MDP8189088.1 hypothetical protein [Pasteurella skyensis]
MSSLNSIIGGYTQNNLCSQLDEWVSILEHYNDEVTDDEVWEIARNHKSFPLFENIYQYCVIEHLKAIFIKQTGCNWNDVKFYSYINCFDTHFSIDGEPILEEDDFYLKIKEVQNLLN